jgi:response regulator RpfG family c-di-GMP phosphodiesterase
MTQTILVVDDENNALSALKRALQPTGYRVLQADSGCAALRKLECNDVDLIISDMRMPGMDGAELLKEVALTHDNVRRIILTGYASVERAVAAINEGGVNRYLTKPWDMEVSAGLASCSSELIKSASINTLITSYRSLAEFQMPDRVRLTEKVTTLVQRVAKQAGLSANERLDIELAARIHRFGELAIPAAIARKCFLDMSAWEWEVYQHYPLITCNMLEEASDPVRKIISRHRDMSSRSDPLWKSREILRVSTEFVELKLERGTHPEGCRKIERYLENSIDVRYPADILEHVMYCGRDLA